MRVVVNFYKSNEDLREPRSPNASQKLCSSCQKQDNHGNREKKNDNELTGANNEPDRAAKDTGTHRNESPDETIETGKIGTVRQNHS